MTRRIIYSLGAWLILSGCIDRAAKAPDQTALRQYALTAVPVGATLAERYQRTCQSCHAKGLGGAPLPGDRQRWNQLLTQRGMDGLVENAIRGYRGMPPMGLCTDCGREDFEALIRFMMQAHDHNK